MKMVIKNRIFNSEQLNRNALIVIFSALFIVIDLMLNRLVLKANLNELEKYGLERSSKFISSNVYLLNETKSDKSLIQKAASNNFKLMKKLMEPPAGNWIHEPLGHFLLHKILIPIIPTSFVSYRNLGNFITSLCLLSFLPIFVFLIIGLNNISYRRLACCLFQMRNVLDYMDGNLIRLDENILVYENNSDYGRLFDEYGSRFPSIALLGGSYVFIFFGLNVENNELKNTGCFFSNMYKVIRWLRKKLGLVNNNFNLATVNGGLLKEIYFKMIMFIVYIILAGIIWNHVYDENLMFYGDYIQIDGVCLILNFLSRNYS